MNWFITGVSSGLGKALALEVMRNEDYVIGTVRNQQDLIAFNEISRTNGHAILMDISKLNMINSTVYETTKKYKIDVLVNNAGVGFAGSIEEASIDEVKEVFDVNFFGTLKLTQAMLPYMRENKFGRIVQISSHAGIKSFPGFGIYNASKFALEGFTEALFHELKPLGIRVSLIEPGPFRTNFAGRSLIIAKQHIEDYAESSGVFKSKLKGVDGKQNGDPLKAARMIYKFVISDHSNLRLPLGEIALESIQTKIKEIQRDIDANLIDTQKTSF